MKIIFNSMNCGLGNNGGSQTIVKSANTLIDLGHDVSIIDTIANKHSWNKLKANHIILKNINNCPLCDIIIGTGIKTFHTTSVCKTAKKKFHWIRGWETWQMSEKKMLEMFDQGQKNIHLVTNGAGIEKILKKNNIKSNIQLAGLDISRSKYISNKEINNKLIVIGGLVNTKHQTKQTEYLYNIFQYLSRITDQRIQLLTFGAEGVRKAIFNNHIHLSHPSVEMKNKIYDQIDFWISSSINEGFHIPPAEFMLFDNGGVVIGVDHPLNGTKHYLKNNITGYVCENNWKQMADLIIEKINIKDELCKLSNNAYHKITDDIGSRKKNMKKFVKLMEQL